MNKLIVTTSWDDGAPEDLRLAERLVAGGLCGTFYLCRDFPGSSSLSNREIRELAQFPGIEIGAHTLTHPDLRRVSARQLHEEIVGSRRWLEDLLGREVSAFCYPKGLHNRRVVRAVAEAHFQVGRTTMSGSTATAADALRMPTTLQFYPHRRATQMRHALKERDLRGLLSIAAVRPWSMSPAALTRAFVAAAGCTEVVLHVWGHSWEVDQHQLWQELDDFVRAVADLPAKPATNSQAIAARSWPGRS